MDTGMPIWLTVALSLVGSLGGFELIKYLINARSNRRKSLAMADQEAAKAGQEDVSLRKAEYELLQSMLQTNKEQYDSLKSDYAAIREERQEQKREIAELKLAVSEMERRVKGMQKAMKEEVIKKKEAEKHYCSVEDCPARKPKLGEYHTQTNEIYQ